MATLNNKKIKDTFKGLLKTLDNAEITGQVEITDGDGNQTGVFINTDGSIKVTGTAEFGSLKDTGEDITITKFVDEADGISNNDDDSSIPTSAAVKDYVDSGVNTNAANISTNTSNISTNTSDISTNTSAIALNTAKNSYPSEDAAKVANISVTQAVDLDTLESNVATNNSKVSFDSASSSKLAGIEANAQVNDVTSVNGQTGSVTLTSSNVNEGTNLYYTDSRVAANSAVAANTAKTGITDQQASAINANTSKVGITTQQADAIVANTAKVGITTDQANAITANTAKVGITTQQASDITTNNAKVSFPEAPNDGDSYVRQSEGWVSLTHPADAVTSVNGETGVVVLDSDDITEGTSNLYYTDSRVSANSSVAANTAKVGITTQQASDITTNNAKVGITTDQANAITANTAKNSYPTADATKLAGIEAGAEVNTVDSVNGQTGTVSLSTTNVSEGTNLYYTDARVTANSSVAANTAKISYNATDSTKVGYISITQAVDLDSVENKQENQYKIIGVAMDYSNRVLSDSGTAEGTQSIMENIETLILN